MNLRTILFFLILLIDHPCLFGQEPSPIIKITYDEKLLSQIESDYDSVSIFAPDDSDWVLKSYFKERYPALGAKYVNKVMRHRKDGHVMLIERRKENKLYFIEEYYPNGQLTAKNPLVNGEYEGYTLYFWPDGRVKMAGMHTQGRPTGEWKTYNESGKLVLIGYYNNNGVLERTENVK